ncbi:hypothetical protein PX860_11415 [Agrobacterium leguminum]|uniref:hypothetical protein n=1 Tax=Agrobacterium leguminum TaxID=2792015 RepID=UPI00272A9FDA|nr:hypothetical protein [Agrobacterium leguminum]WLD96171.1 hypothetical protein PX860_11415 [Agrobacterium leguminum]
MSNPSNFTLNEILARKAEARRVRASLSFAEKIRIVEKMRERLAPFKAIRDRNKSGAASQETPQR